jgi:hypothetical protein
MMIDKYIDYRVDKLIADYKDNCTTLANLKTQLENMDGFGSGQSGERVQTSPSNNAMDNLIIRREQVQKQIDEYESTLEIYNKAWESLNEQEQFILREFLQKNQSKVMACEMVRQKYFIQPSKIYDLRRDALRRMRKLVFGE